MSDSLICHRCGAILQPGEDGFYIVRVEAFADPTPQKFTEDDLDRDLEAELEQLVDQMRNASQRELADQVHRRLTLHLCRDCYEVWIENPTGS